MEELKGGFPVTKEGVRKGLTIDDKPMVPKEVHFEGFEGAKLEAHLPEEKKEVKTKEEK